MRRAAPRAAATITTHSTADRMPRPGPVVTGSSPTTSSSERVAEEEERSTCEPRVSLALPSGLSLIARQQAAGSVAPGAVQVGVGLDDPSVGTEAEEQAFQPRSLADGQGDAHASFGHLLLRLEGV